MRKLRFGALLLVLLMFCAPVGKAHDYKDQEKDLQKVLFGPENYSSYQEQKQKNAITALAYAQNLTEDEFSGNQGFANRLRSLREYGVQGLPDDISKIDFGGNQYHQNFVNVRWNPYKEPEKGNWSVRKNILLTTVNYVFDFGFGTDTYLFGKPIVKLNGEQYNEQYGKQPINGYTKQCNAFAALLCYVHQIGDIATDGYNPTVFPLARAHPGETNADIIWDLMEIYLPDLFPSQVDSDEYRNLMYDLNEIAIDVRALVESIGGINTTEKKEKYKNYAGDVIEVLSKHIPKLLHNEKFFADVFYRDDT